MKQSANHAFPVHASYSHHPHLSPVSGSKHDQALLEISKIILEEWKHAIVKERISLPPLTWKKKPVEMKTRGEWHRSWEGRRVTRLGEQGSDGRILVVNYTSPVVEEEEYWRLVGDFSV